MGGLGESSRFECRNKNWVTKIWRTNMQCMGEPDVVDTAPCIHPHCTCSDTANKNNKLVEFKMFDDPSCSGDSFSTAAAVIDQCFEYNQRGYILKCNDATVTRIEYNDINCYGVGKSSDITPMNTENYCYSIKCGTNSVRFEGNKGTTQISFNAILYAFMVSTFMLLQN